MSEEEKKAIEIQDSISILKNTDLDINNIYSIDLRTYDFAVKTVLNLIETQKKEIEELKEDNKHQWEERCKLTFELENSTSKDKIKAKIEEYDDKGMTVNSANRRAGKTFQEAVKYEVRAILRSLLKEE